MKKKGMAALFALMLSGVLIAGCGSKDSETKENTDQTETSAQEEASEDQVQEEAEETATEETAKKRYLCIHCSQPEKYNGGN